MSELPHIASSAYASSTVGINELVNRLGPFQVQDHRFGAARPTPPPAPQGNVQIMANPTRRLVQVFIADPNENVPLKQCLLYSGEQQVTDLTDQELFFEIDLKVILEKHNAERVKMLDRSIKERSEYLEPARIRDLKMTVVTIAQF